MATANTRGGRRRWMLHEDVRAGIAAVDEETFDADGTARRYAFDNQSASFAVATRLLPQRLLAIAGMLIGGMAVVAGLAAADSYSATVCQWLGVENLPAAQWASSHSVGGWLSNLLLNVAAMLCLLIYGLRRHRLDDFHGKYRRWLAAASACALASLLLSTGLHHSLAQAGANATGFTALPGDAIWWLLPAAAIFGWIVVRVALDMRPCRLGLFSLAIAAGLYLTALAGHFGLVPQAAVEIISPPVAQLAGHVWLVIALVAQVRYILLEASGVIAPAIKAEKAERDDEQQATAKSKPARSTPEKTTPSNSWTQQPVAPAIVSMTAADSRKSATTQPLSKKSLIAAARGETQWVDGRSSRDSDDDDQEDGRPLSKADRKRLRKEQARRAA